MAKGYLYDNGYELISREEALPDASEASHGDVLSLDSEKKPVWSEPSGGLPDTTSASQGDVLSLDSDKEPVWTTPSGGGEIPKLYFDIDDTDIDNLVISFYEDNDWQDPLSFAELKNIGKFQILASDGSYVIGGICDPNLSASQIIVKFITEFNRIMFFYEVEQSELTGVETSFACRGYTITITPYSD